MHSGHRGLPCFAWPLLPNNLFGGAGDAKPPSPSWCNLKTSGSQQAAGPTCRSAPVPQASPPASSPKGSHSPPQPLPHCPPGPVPVPSPPLPPPRTPQALSAHQQIPSSPSLSRKGKKKGGKKDHDITGRFIWVCLFACWLD